MIFNVCGQRSLVGLKWRNVTTASILWRKRSSTFDHETNRSSQWIGCHDAHRKRPAARNRRHDKARICATRPSPCRVVDPTLGSLEWTWKLGPEEEFGPVRAGASIYKNAMTGATGGKVEAGITFVAGFEADRPTPEGGNLGGTTEGFQYSMYLFGFVYNFNLRKLTFNPGKTFFFGRQDIFGGELSFNSDKFKQINGANQVCRSQGGE